MIAAMRWIALVLPLSLVGCVERLISVRSEPPGAAVFLDGERAGETPCDIKYVWYGTRTLTLEKPGYVSVTRAIELKTPWWQIFPFDFITDVVIPFTIRDRTEVQFLLQKEPTEAVDVEAMRKRAAELKEKAQQPDK